MSSTCPLSWSSSFLPRCPCPLPDPGLPPDWLTTSHQALVPGSFQGAAAASTSQHEVVPPLLGSARRSQSGSEALALAYSALCPYFFFFF